MSQIGASTELFAGLTRQFGALTRQFGALAKPFWGMAQQIAAMAEQIAAISEQIAAIPERFAGQKQFTGNLQNPAFRGAGGGNLPGPLSGTLAIRPHDVVVMQMTR